MGSAITANTLDRAMCGLRKAVTDERSKPGAKDTLAGATKDSFVKYGADYRAWQDMNDWVISVINWMCNFFPGYYSNTQVEIESKKNVLELEGFDNFAKAVWSYNPNEQPSKPVEFRVGGKIFKLLPAKNLFLTREETGPLLRVVEGVDPSNSAPGCWSVREIKVFLLHAYLADQRSKYPGTPIYLSKFIFSGMQWDGLDLSDCRLSTQDEEAVRNSSAIIGEFTRFS